MRNLFSIKYNLKKDEENKYMLFVSSYQLNSKIEEHFVGYIDDILLKNKQLQNKLNTLNNEIDRFIKIIQQQPSKDDSYLLEKLNSFKFIIRGE